MSVCPLLLAACGGETPPQLVRGQLEESARPLVRSAVAMGVDGLRGRSGLDALGRFLLAVPADGADSYQLQLVGVDSELIVPLAGQNGRLKVCEAEKEIDLGYLRVVRGCEGSCSELEIGLADCEQRNYPICERARIDWQVCLERMTEGCMVAPPDTGLCAQELCASEEQLVNAACGEACAPLADGLQRCFASAQQSCIFPMVAVSELGLPSEIGCIPADGMAGM